jgi:hypothetical protein
MEMAIVRAVYLLAYIAIHQERCVLLVWLVSTTSQPLSLRIPVQQLAPLAIGQTQPILTATNVTFFALHVLDQELQFASLVLTVISWHKRLLHAL